MIHIFRRTLIWFILSTIVLEGTYSASIDLLYWKAHEKSIALTNKASPVFYTNDFTTASTIDPHFDWDLGFRLGIGSSFSCQPVDFSFIWTYYSTTIHQHRTTDSNDLTNVNGQLGMFPIWALSEDIIPGDYVSEAKLKWNINLNLFDLKSTFSQFWFLPSIGIRTAFIQQNAHIKYSGGIFLYDILEGGVNVNGTDRIRMKNNFWGIGPRIGLEPRWNFLCNFAVFGNFGVSALIGQFDIDQKERFLGVSRFSHHKKSVRLCWIADCAAGICWEDYLCNGCLTQIQLAWEYQLFFDQLQLKRDKFHLTSSNRNLDLQGVTLSGKIGF